MIREVRAEEEKKSGRQQLLSSTLFLSLSNKKGAEEKDLLTRGSQIRGGDFA